MKISFIARNELGDERALTTCGGEMMMNVDGSKIIEQTHVRVSTH